MLLNELQKQNQHVQQPEQRGQQQDETIRMLQEQNREQIQKNRSLESRLAALELLRLGKVPTSVTSGQ
jgi:hypothetical protein